MLPDVRYGERISEFDITFVDGNRTRFGIPDIAIGFDKTDLLLSVSEIPVALFVAMLARPQWIGM